MSEIKDLQGDEAVKKLTELVNDIRMCMFCTFSSHEYFETRPMATLNVDDQGRVWFLSDKQSDKNQDLKHSRKVQLIYAKPSSTEFLSIRGTAFETRDSATIDELWNQMAAAWFKGGKDDPNLSAVCVTPVEARYWDTKHGKIISLLKIAAAAMSKKVMDDGVEGRLDIGKR